MITLALSLFKSHTLLFSISHVKIGYYCYVEYDTNNITYITTVFIKSLNGELETFDRSAPRTWGRKKE